jgi:hypothetical protein
MNPLSRAGGRDLNRELVVGPTAATLAGAPVAQDRPASEERLDELYREHPDRFVAGRDELAKELRAAGQREEGDRVKRRRRPTVAAWLINRAALSSPADLERFAEASTRLEEAQGRALAGEEDAAEGWRAAASNEREATAAVVAAADRSAREAGHPASERALELVAETLRAASGEPELREQVVAGRVERERSAATLGTPVTGAVPRRDRAGAKRRDRAQAHRELERLERELDDATAREERQGARVEEAAEALRRERKRLAESRRESAALRRQVKAAERRAKR